MNDLVSFYHSEGILNWWSWQICSLKNNDTLQGKLLSHTDYLDRDKNSNHNYKYTCFWVQRNICKRMEVFTGIIANSKSSFHVIIAISELSNLLPGSLWVYKCKSNWNGNYLHTLIFNTRIINIGVDMSLKVLTFCFHSLTLWLWTSYLKFLCLSFFICKTETFKFWSFIKQVRWYL